MITLIHEDHNVYKLLIREYVTPKLMKIVPQIYVRGVSKF